MTNWTRIAQKDFRRLWPLLLCVGFLAVISVVLPFHPVVDTLVNPLEPIAGDFRWFLIAFISVVAVQDDPCESDRGGWLARPITGGSVWTAKLALFVIGLCLPEFLAAFCGAAAAGAPVWSAVRAGGAFGGATFLLSLGCGLLAASTRSLLQAAGGAVILEILHLFTGRNWDSFAHWITVRSAAFGGWPRFVPAGEQFAIRTIGLLIGASLLLWYQYRNRRTALLIAAASVGGLFLWLASVGWPWMHWVAPRRLTPAPDALALVVADRQALLKSVERRVFPLRDKVTVGVTLRETGPLAIAPLSSRARWRGDDGREFVMAEPTGVDVSPVDRQERSSLPTEQFLPFGWPDARTESVRKPFVGDLAAFTPSFYNSEAGHRGKLDAWLLFARSEVKSVGRLPLRSGAEITRPGERFRVKALFILPHGRINVRLELVAVDWMPAGGSMAFYNFVLMNHRENEVSGSEEGDLYTDWTAYAPVHGGARSVVFRSAWNLTTKARREGLDESWARDAEVVIYRLISGPPMTAHIDFGEIQLPSTPVRD